MKIKEDIKDIVLKRACGFSYTEETVEFERKKNVCWVLCKNYGRLVYKTGSYLKVQKSDEEAEKCKVLMWKENREKRNKLTEKTMNLFNLSKKFTLKKCEK